ncbi:alpha/beta fold hydrolase [Galactobacter caseinivorans]|uniref:Alpha/beta fold hydrolase n=1 Tax=Galactobacter caseinivorans TaxID=2676123 RepID=A0A496PLM6_9MICC|nr:alpha/beta fold hydrolase [Galactobacter caseinivorans]RKW71366.1 alpha/beta fold hydrolase [Galactobacter caseinivorans]
MSQVIPVDQTQRPQTRQSHPGWRRGVALVAGGALALAAAVAGSAGGALPTAEAADPTPNVKALAGALSKQKLTWETCDFGSDELNTRFNVANVKCATVKVPRDWKNPSNGKTWDIRISQAKNIDVKNPRYKGTMFINPGGPGGEGLPWGPAMQERTPDLNPYYNYVGFDPRGVGQSSQASCSWTWDSNSTDKNASLKAAGKACAANEDVRTINTEQTAYDMDFIRTLLAAPKLSYVGYSYGTWLGAWYEKVFGAKYGDKFVLDSATDVTDATLQQTWEMQPIARDRQFQRHMMNWIARQDSSYALGTDPQAIYKRYVAASNKLDDFTVLFLWSFLGGAGAFGVNEQYPQAANVVSLVIEWGEEAEAAAKLKTAGAKNPASAALTMVKSLKASKNGLSAKQLDQAKAKLSALGKMETVAQRSDLKVKQFAARTLKNVEGAAEAGVSQGTLTDPFDMIRCNDGQWTQGAAYWDAYNKKTTPKAPVTAKWGFLSDPPLCAFWRTSQMMPVADSTFPKTVVIQGEQDSQTSWETGYATGVKLPNTSFIAIDNEGSHGHFPYGTEAVDRPVYNYLLNGTMPKDIKVNQAVPLPRETATYESWRKLNSKAVHTGPMATDAFIVTDGTPTVTAAGKIARKDDALLNKSSDQKELERQVATVYGKKGVDAVRNAG